jgi:hypothetical protein
MSLCSYDDIACLYVLRGAHGDNVFSLSCMIYYIYIYIQYSYMYVSEVGGVRAPAHPNREIVFVFVRACVQAGGRAEDH